MAEAANDLPPRFAEVVKEARALMEGVEEAQGHFRAGDLQAAADILALTHYKSEAVAACRAALQARLGDLGHRPGN